MKDIFKEITDKEKNETFDEITPYIEMEEKIPSLKDKVIKKIREDFEEAYGRTHTLTRDPDDENFYLYDDVQDKFSGYFAAAFDKEIASERAFSVLESFGVPKGRSVNVANGIQVLMQRINKERMGWEYERQQLEKDKEELLENIKYFTDRVEAGTIHSKTTYAMYTNLLAKMQE